MIIVTMGVSGSGKSTIGRTLAAALGWPFQEGDDLHPQANIEKMSAGIALEDEDRWPWLDRIAGWMTETMKTTGQGVVACSALKHSYRERLRSAGGRVAFVYIQVSRNVLQQRLLQRQHFMPASLLDSQLHTLEEPAQTEDALTVPGEQPLADTLAAVEQWLAPQR